MFYSLSFKFVNNDTTNTENDAISFFFNSFPLHIKNRVKNTIIYGTIGYFFLYCLLNIDTLKKELKIIYDYFLTILIIDVLIVCYMYQENKLKTRKKINNKQYNMHTPHDNKNIEHFENVYAMKQNKLRNNNNNDNYQIEQDISADIDPIDIPIHKPKNTNNREKKLDNNELATSLFDAEPWATDKSGVNNTTERLLTSDDNIPTDFDMKIYKPKKHKKI